MATAAHLSSPLESMDSKAATAAALNAVLATSFASYFAAKNYHWHVSGAHFQALHRFFDEIAGELLASSDALAERVRTLGHRTIRSAEDVVALKAIPAEPASELTSPEMLRRLRRNNDLLITALRKARVAADADEDHATISLLDELLGQAEKRGWLLAETGASLPKPMAPIDPGLLSLL